MSKRAKLTAIFLLSGLCGGTLTYKLLRRRLTPPPKKVRSRDPEFAAMLDRHKEAVTLFTLANAGDLNARQMLMARLDETGNSDVELAIMVGATVASTMNSFAARTMGVSPVDVWRTAAAVLQPFPVFGDEDE